MFLVLTWRESDQFCEKSWSVKSLFALFVCLFFFFLNIHNLRAFQHIIGNSLTVKEFLSFLYAFCQFRERGLTDEGKKVLIKIYIKYIWPCKLFMVHITSDTEALKGHLSLTWKSVFVLLKMGVWIRKWEFVFGNGSSKIGICFKLRPRLCGFFSHVGLTSVKARSLEDWPFLY